MWCSHKYGKVEVGYQYCEKCGKAIVVLCIHKWKRINPIEATRHWKAKKIVVGWLLECEHCGEMKEFTVK